MLLLYAGSSHPDKPNELSKSEYDDASFSEGYVDGRCDFQFGSKTEGGTASGSSYLFDDVYGWL